jgi:aspartate/methionine/tyrosine aminotransferase
MQIAPFALERYFARHEFSAHYLLSSSDCESLSLSELLDLADAETRLLWNALKLGYTETPGHPLLRQAIADQYESLSAQDVLVMAPEESIFLLIHALLEPGDHVVCTFPAYQSLHEVARSIGCQVTYWEPDETHGWAFDLEQLNARLQANTRLIVINFPHNPTGYLPSRADFKALVDLVRQRGVYLFSDEMYRFLEIEEGATLPAACELYDRAISLSGLSKAYGLPGLRIGWLATGAAGVLERVARLKDYTTICNSAPSEILAIIALRNRESILTSQLDRLRDNLGFLDAFFGSYPDCFQWNRPLGGSICLPRMTAVEDTYSFCEELVTETSIMLVPSRVLQFGDNHVRMGFGRQNLPEVLSLFSDYLEWRFR